MRLFVMLFAFSLLATSGDGAESKPRIATLQISGQEYLSLQDWGECNQFQFVRKEEQVLLTNRIHRVTLKLNSQRAEIDGVMLFLAFPVWMRQNAIWVAEADLERSLRPILFPPKNKNNERVKVVAISAGHGGKDSGYQVSGQQEKKYTLLLAQELQKLCARAGFKPILIRNSDRFVEREERTRLAKRGKANLYVELHYNCAGPGNTESKGVEVYCLTLDGANSTNGGSDQYRAALAGNRHDPKNMLLAYQIHSALVSSAGLTDRGIRRARFEVLRDAEMPAVLIEAGFMSQPDELKKIQDAGHRRATAQAILDGLLAYKKLVEPNR